MLTNYNNYDEFINLMTDSFAKSDNRLNNLREVFNIFVQVRNIMRYSDNLNDCYKIKNIKFLTANNLFLIHELLVNIVLKNYISVFSLIRILIENMYTMTFLKNTSNMINEIYSDYNDLCTFNIWNDEKIEKYEKKYSVTIKKNKSKQWIDQIKGKSNYNGFSYIIHEVNSLKKEFYSNWYSWHSYFIHSSISATRLNISLFLDDNDNYVQFKNDFLDFIVCDLHRLYEINEDYLDISLEQKRETIEAINEFYEKYTKK